MPDMAVGHRTQGSATSRYVLQRPVCMRGIGAACEIAEREDADPSSAWRSSLAPPTCRQRRSRAARKPRPTSARSSRRRATRSASASSLPRSGTRAVHSPALHRATSALRQARCAIVTGAVNRWRAPSAVRPVARAFDLASTSRGPRIGGLAAAGRCGKSVVASNAPRRCALLIRRGDSGADGSPGRDLRNRTQCPGGRKWLEGPG